MVHENDVRFVVPKKYLEMSAEKRSRKIEKAFDKMKSQAPKKKTMIKNSSINFKF